MAVEPAPFLVGGTPAIRGEAAGEGPTIVLCHGLTATRRTVVHGSRRLERSGHRVIAYDARGHGESDPAPPGGGYGYSQLVADLERVIESEAGGDRVLLAGHSMGAHTALAFALSRPELVAGLVVVGPAYDGAIAPDSLRYWDGLEAALREDGIDGFVAYVERAQPVDPAWRAAVLRFTRERMERHRHLGAVADALHEVPRSRPFDRLEALVDLELPVLVVASQDDSDPGHPYAVARRYAELLPRARLIGEAPGQSPLAWQGGRLAREIEAFHRELQ